MTRPAGSFGSVSGWPSSVGLRHTQRVPYMPSSVHVLHSQQTRLKGAPESAPRLPHQCCVAATPEYDLKTHAQETICQTAIRQPPWQRPSQSHRLDSTHTCLHTWNVVIARTGDRTSTRGRKIPFGSWMSKLSLALFPTEDSNEHPASEMTRCKTLIMPMSIPKQKARGTCTSGLFANRNNALAPAKPIGFPSMISDETVVLCERVDSTTCKKPPRWMAS